MSRRKPNLNEDSPEYKVLQGVSGSTDLELLAALIGGKQSITCARTILSLTKGNLRQVGRLTPAVMVKITGVGYRRAARIIATFEIARRVNHAEDIKRVQVTSSNDAYKSVAPMMVDLLHEEVWLITMNRANYIVNKTRISQGGVSSTIVDPKIIALKCIEDMASGAIIVHNHPSGSLEPSGADMTLTAKVKDGLRLLDVKLLDHLIISSQGYVSFADEGWL
jgi:DNA repair protein RadC